MRLAFLALLAVLAPASASAAPAASAPVDDLLAWIEPEAAAIVRFDPASLEAVADLGAALPAGTSTRNLIAAGAAAVTGFNPLVARGWTGAGFTDGPMLLQIAAIDARAAWSAGRASAAAPLWRHRLVARAADPAAAVATLGRALALRDRVRPGQGDEEALVALLDVPAGRAPAVDRRLARAGVLFLARLPGAGALVLVHAHDSIVVVDVLVPFAGGPLRWQTHAQALRRRTLPPRAVRNAELRAPLAVWLRPRPLVAAIEAADWEDSEPGSLARRHSRCRPLRAVAQQSSLAALAIDADVGRGAVSLRLRWTPRDVAALRTALATRADGVRAPSPTLALSAVLRLAGTAGLRALARPPLLADRWEAPLESARDCGVAALPALIAFAWPELAGLFLDELAAVDPSAALLLDHIGNVAVAARRIATTFGDTEGIAEASVRPGARALVAGWFDVLFADRRDRGGARSWGRGPLRGYQREGIFGFAAGGGAGALPAPSSPAPTPGIAIAHVELAALPAPWSVLGALGHRAHARLRFVGGELVAELRLERHTAARPP